MKTHLRGFFRHVAVSTCALFGLFQFPLAAPAAPARAVTAKAGAAIIDAAKYPNLQAALDAVPEAGGTVLLPPGNFEVTRPLVLIRGDTRIAGSGPATHLINRSTSGEPALIVRPHDRAQNRRARMWRVQLENFRISGNPGSGDGVFLEGVNEPFVHGLSVDHNGGHGVHLVDCYEDPRIANSIITYNAKAGVNLQACHDIVVNGNQFEENQDALRCIDSFNLTMSGNNVDDHLRHGVVIENTYGSVLSGNMIEECRGTAIILDRDCYGITLSANVIAHEEGGGIELRDAWGCAVSANTFVLIRKFGILVGPDSGRIAITGNSFANSYIGLRDKRPAEKISTPQGAEANGVVLRGTRDVVITGNSFSGLATEAVQAEGECQRIIVSANVMTDLHRRSGEKKPAVSLGGATASIVKDNAIEAGFD